MDINAISAYSGSVYSGIAGNIGVNRSGMFSSLNKLSSGLKINTAGDSPSGLAMSERLRSLIGRYEASAANAGNALSYLKTSDGFMQSIQNTVGRMQELAIAANDGTKSDTDRMVLAAEFEELKGHISDITEGASPLGAFNGIPLFQGDSISVAIGPESGEEMAFSKLNLTADGDQEIGVDNAGDRVSWSSVVASAADGGITISTQASATEGIAALTMANDYLSQARAVRGAEYSRVEHTIEGVLQAQVNSLVAESGIRDTDMALEMINFSRYQAMTSLGYNMLSQRTSGSVLAVA